jgi:hypothetical protein
MVAGLTMGGCSPVRTMALWTAPSKAPSAQRSDAKSANAKFWDVFHGGHYEAIPETLDGLTAAYLENPGDAETAAHIGWMHIWRASESARNEHLAPTVTDDVVLSHKYFGEAVALNPDDARYFGFLASTELIEGTIHKDEKLTRRGYFDLMESVSAWPEFNLFTAGYVMSGLPHTDDKYKDALDYQWETLDKCAGEKVDRKTAAYTKYMPLETTQGKKRVCWNSWIAPHNFEGFFLNMGDMLVKEGDPATARNVYAQAKVSKTYASWPYRDVLERRMADAEANVPLFQKPPPKTVKASTRIMLDSKFACMACHQS